MMTRLITYYHATPLENLESISRDGIKTNFGEVYCSTNAEAAGRWICFTRMHCRFIAVIPFKRNEHDLSIELGVDHSSMMTKILGVPDEGASFTSSKPIEYDDIEWDDVMFVHNPNYNHEYAVDLHEERSAGAKVKAMLANDDAHPIHELFTEEEE